MEGEYLDNETVIELVLLQLVYGPAWSIVKQVNKRWNKVADKICDYNSNHGQPLRAAISIHSLKTSPEYKVYNKDTVLKTTFLPPKAYNTTLLYLLASSSKTRYHPVQPDIEYPFYKLYEEDLVEEDKTREVEGVRFYHRYVHPSKLSAVQTGIMKRNGHYDIFTFPGIQTVGLMDCLCKSFYERNYEAALLLLGKKFTLITLATDDNNNNHTTKHEEEEFILPVLKDECFRNCIHAINCDTYDAEQNTKYEMAMANLFVVERGLVFYRQLVGNWLNILVFVSKCALVKQVWTWILCVLDVLDDESDIDPLDPLDVRMALNGVWSAYVDGEWINLKHNKSVQSCVGKAFLWKLLDSWRKQPNSRFSPLYYYPPPDSAVVALIDKKNLKYARYALLANHIEGTIAYSFGNLWNSGAKEPQFTYLPRGHTPLPVHVNWLPPSLMYDMDKYGVFNGGFMGAAAMRKRALLDVDYYTYIVENHPAILTEMLVANMPTIYQLIFGGGAGGGPPYTRLGEDLCTVYETKTPASDMTTTSATPSPPPRIPLECFVSGCRLEIRQKAKGSGLIDANKKYLLDYRRDECIAKKHLFLEYICAHDFQYVPRFDLAVSHRSYNNIAHESNVDYQPRNNMRDLAAIMEICKLTANDIPIQVLVNLLKQYNWGGEIIPVEKMLEHVEVVFNFVELITGSSSVYCLTKTNPDDNRREVIRRTLYHIFNGLVKGKAIWLGHLNGGRVDIITAVCNLVYEQRYERECLESAVESIDKSETLVDVEPRENMEEDDNNNNSSTHEPTSKRMCHDPKKVE